MNYRDVLCIAFVTKHMRINVIKDEIKIKTTMSKHRKPEAGKNVDVVALRNTELFSTIMKCQPV